MDDSQRKLISIPKNEFAADSVNIGRSSRLQRLLCIANKAGIGKFTPDKERYSSVTTISLFAIFARKSSPT
jgi:hypothetical protein